MKKICFISGVLFMFSVFGCRGGKILFDEPVCGNGILERGEDCDGDDLGGATCESLGLGEGELGCTDSCTFDTSDCEIQAVCGNGILEQGEDCDGDDLGGATCESLGLGAGELGCTDTCTFDTSDCEIQPECGNNVREGTEVCDGTDLDGKTCEDFDYEGGDLSCLEDCSGFDFSECKEEEEGFCGDGIINGDEECDGDDLGGMETCADFGCRSEGVVTCTEDCTFDISDCLSGHDESGDGIDDNCDNCPGYYNPDQEDTNGDGVGDVCEAPGDHDLISSIVVFDPFLDDEDSWSQWLDGTWNYGGDIVSGSRSGAGSNYLHDHPLPDGPYAVEATFYYAESAWAQSNWAGVIFAVQNRDLPSFSGYNCMMERESQNLGIWRRPGSGSWTQRVGADVQTTATDDQWRKIHLFYDGDGLTCIYLDETGAFEMIELPGNLTADDLTGQAGLRVFNERAVFTSFVIYE